MTTDEEDRSGQASSILPLGARKQQHGGRRRLGAGTHPLHSPIPSAKGVQPPEPIPRALTFLRTPPTARSLGSLFPGSKFFGEQRSGHSSYHVTVDILTVDLDTSFLSGYLCIDGLTDDYPQLKTFFEAEIIGPKHSFLTRKWEANESTDREHWNLFPPFLGLDQSFNDDSFHYDPLSEDYVFMRWKEHFLVPNHRVQNVNGASYAGFYYICFHRSTSTIRGFYYHISSEKHQKLLLGHVPARSFSSFSQR
ncbi:vacuolar import and degradation protein-domain-containing protein [Piptocephalis cylindrospora]|uniref:Vacuolar import and degradation protein-domain-containing protein n=1 Tax=Piptocephalis cylindrospora TaxID=1907219 RepID=A0A4P9XZN4_9FUNG|nr:vacuolar import and degradation protein-domain-containing protein [Piptocephalis cylindrospora]|eukprot:RKP11612.1 vacuolar import and degradation protein-domain-containing protein [Piptocephalis cylindrospora]